jgi:AcrR family transcriptional regulator
MSEVASRSDSADAGVRARLTSVSADLFASQGYSATTTRQIAKAAGFTNGTLYYYCKTKEDLLDQICRQSLHRITAEVSAGIAEVDGARRRLHILIHRHITTMLADQALHRTMLMELRSLGAERRQQITALRDDYAAVVRRVLIEGQDAGIVRRDIDLRHQALILLNMMNWTIFWYAPQGPLDPAELAEAIETVFVEGVSVR